MAGTLERIERDLAALGEASANLASEFHSSYSSYLTNLGQAVRQQLILASYQICTQGYPDSFLQLSFAQREQLQKDLRQLANHAREQLLSHVEASQQSDAVAEIAPDDKLDDLPVKNPTAIADNISTAQISNPEQLAEWQDNREKAIAYILHHLSRNTNRLLQQAAILPNQLPEALLEAAAKAEAAGEGMPGPPNLLNLLIETENSADSESSKVTHIIALNLRLSEIEFADSALMASRNQIRNLSLRLNTLRREYKKKQRERIIAEAEFAWRTSWGED